GYGNSCFHGHGYIHQLPADHRRQSRHYWRLRADRLRGQPGHQSASRARDHGDRPAQSHVDGRAAALLYAFLGEGRSRETGKRTSGSIGQDQFRPVMSFVSGLPQPVETQQVASLLKASATRLPAKKFPAKFPVLRTSYSLLAATCQQNQRLSKKNPKFPANSLFFSTICRFWADFEDFWAEIKNSLQISLFLGFPAPFTRSGGLR